MKVIMMRPSFVPELSGGTHLALDLVNDFIKSGWEVELIVTLGKKYEALVDEKQDITKVHRIKSKFTGTGILKRILRYIDTSIKMYKTAISIKDADLIMTHSMPPLLGPLGAIAGKKLKLPVLYWEQDIVSESLLSTGIFGKSGIKQKILYFISREIEKFSQNKSTHIVTICEQFKRMHLERGAKEDKLSVVYNWIDINQIYPISKEDNPLFDELGIEKDKFTVTYCGNLGVPQNVEILVDAAKQLENKLPIQFIIIGGGSREKKVCKYIEETNASNLKYFPLLPLEYANYVYNIGKVGLVIGRKGTAKNGFPSKTWSIMAAAQAMIACFDLDSELSKFVREGNCGLAVEPDSVEQLVLAITELYENQEKCNEYGKNARRFVVENFERSKATKQIIACAEGLVKSK